MAETTNTGRMAPPLRRMLLPLALAQFICSFAGSNMNVMINDISQDLHTTVQGVQIAITLFLLVMAALMIPAGKLTDRWGRKRCFTMGLSIYAVGAVLSAAAPGLGVLILGNSILEGVGTALLIPPVYILTTMLFHDLRSRAQAFGIISGMGGIGAATGPLIGGFITTAITWRAAFVFQAVVVVVIVFLGRRIQDPLPADPTRPFDTVGAILSAAGLVILVVGILAADNNLALCALLIVVGALILVGFFAWVRSRERAGKEALLSTKLFRNRTSNLGLVTQNVQWLMLMGTSFVVSAYLQVVRHYSAIKTGVIFTAATVGILVSSLAAGALAKRFQQRTLILDGVRDDDRRCGVPPPDRQALAERMGLRAGAAAHRAGTRGDADPVGERGPVRLSRGPAERDLWSVPLCLESRFDTGYRYRRHHSRLRVDRPDAVLCPRHDRRRGDRSHRAWGHGVPPESGVRVGHGGVAMSGSLTRARSMSSASIPADENYKATGRFISKFARSVIGPGMCPLQRDDEACSADRRVVPARKAPFPVRRARVVGPVPRR